MNYEKHTKDIETVINEINDFMQKIEPKKRNGYVQYIVFESVHWFNHEYNSHICPLFILRITGWDKSYKNHFAIKEN